MIQRYVGAPLDDQILAADLTTELALTAFSDSRTKTSDVLSSSSGQGIFTDPDEQVIPHRGIVH